MIKSDKNFLHAELTDKIIACAYDVYNQLGFGFSEKAYENSMMIKIAQKGLTAFQQALVNVFFEKQLVGEFFSDILVENKVIVELKAISTLQKAHEAQLIHYLKATGIKVGLLMNFGEKFNVVRRVY
jgi:GxxExxY protein